MGTPGRAFVRQGCTAGNPGPARDRADDDETRGRHVRVENGLRSIPRTGPRVSEELRGKSPGQILGKHYQRRPLASFPDLARIRNSRMGRGRAVSGIDEEELSFSVEAATGPGLVLCTSFSPRCQTGHLRIRWQTNS